LDKRTKKRGRTSQTTMILNWEGKHKGRRSKRKEPYGVNVGKKYNHKKGTKKDRQYKSEGKEKKTREGGGGQMGKEGEEGWRTISW